jgi:hypothetical protein
MEFLSGGHYRATIHRFVCLDYVLIIIQYLLHYRVVQPPPDQQSYNRLGAFYFAMSDDNIKLAPLTQSLVLQRVGIKRRFEDNEAPTMEEWRKSRTSAYGQSDLTKKGKVEEEVINGVLVKHYN